MRELQVGLFLKFVTIDYVTRTSNWLTPLATEILSANLRYPVLQDLIFSSISQRPSTCNMIEKVVLIKRF